MARRLVRLILLLLLLLAAAGFGLVWLRLLPAAFNPLEPVDLAERPNFVTPAKLWLMEGDVGACLAALRGAGVAAEPLPARREGPGCERNGTILVSRLWRATIRPEEMNCGLALRLYLLERHKIQPLAQRRLGSAVAEITHLGSYACRTKRGGLRMSEHASANALDISGFRLADGRMVTLKTDWSGGGAKARFLREVGVRACLLFNMVLGPDYNRDHADHFHVDMGWAMGCH
jgi:hypothetical protein